MRRILLITALCTLVMPIGGEVRAGSRCVASGRPSARLLYTEELMRLRLTFSLKGCHGDHSIFGATYSAARNDVLTERLKEGSRLCAGTVIRRCTLVVRFGHPPVERASYDFHVSFPRAGGGEGEYRRALTCVSALAATDCLR